MQAYVLQHILPDVLHVLAGEKHCLGSCLRPQLPKALFDSSSGLLQSCFLCCRRLVFFLLWRALTLSPPLTSFICDAVLSDARQNSVGLLQCELSWNSLSSRSRTLPSCIPKISRSRRVSSVLIK